MPHALADDIHPAYDEDQLFVNDGPLEPGQVSWLKPTTLDTPMEEMHRRYSQEGYLFLKGLLPRSDVLHARSEYFSMLSPSGVLKPGTTPVAGIFDTAKDALDFPGIGAGGTAEANGRPSGPHASIAEKFVDLALAAHYEEWYKSFCRHPDLLDFVARFTGWGQNTLGIQRTLLRNNTPGNRAIGVHYDQIFLRYGEDTAVTAWVPIGDVKVTGGGLIYLERGYNLGEEIEADFTRKAKECGMSDEEARNAFNTNMVQGGMLSHEPAEFGKQHGRRWLVANYEAGDVVLHNAYAIHASTINHDPDGVIRLGTDLRFVDKSRPWDTRWDKDYAFGDGV